MGTHNYAYLIEAARLTANIEAAITSALFDISDHSARHENGGDDVLSLAGLAVAIGDVTGHDTALHDGLNIDADTVDTKHANDLQFAQNEEISLGNIPLSIYTPQSVTGETHTALKIIDNATDIEFYINDKPSTPTGFTLKSRFYSIIKTSDSAKSARVEIYKITDAAAIATMTSTSEVYFTERSSLFDIPDNTKDLTIRIWNLSATGTTYCIGTWIEYIAVKD